MESVLENSNFCKAVSRLACVCVWVGEGHKHLLKNDLTFDDLFVTNREED